MPSTHTPLPRVSVFDFTQVAFAKRLKLLGHEVELTVAPGVPHGFLNFVHTASNTSEIAQAAMICEGILRRVFDVPPADEATETLAQATTTAVVASAKSLALFSQYVVKTCALVCRVSPVWAHAAVWHCEVSDIRRLPLL